MRVGNRWEDKTDNVKNRRSESALESLAARKLSSSTGMSGQSD